MDPGGIDPGMVFSAIDDWISEYVEHHDPGQHHDRLPDRDLDPIVEKLLKLNPVMSLEDAVHTGFQTRILSGRARGLRLSGP
jgi:hypothetical protein